MVNSTAGVIATLLAISASAADAAKQNEPTSLIDKKKNLREKSSQQQRELPTRKLDSPYTQYYTAYDDHKDSYDHKPSYDHHDSYDKPSYDDHSKPSYKSGNSDDGWKGHTQWPTYSPTEWKSSRSSGHGWKKCVSRSSEVREDDMM